MCVGSKKRKSGLYIPYKPLVGCEPLGSRDTPRRSCFGGVPTPLPVGHAFSFLLFGDVSESRWLRPSIQDVWQGDRDELEHDLAIYHRHRSQPQGVGSLEELNQQCSALGHKG